MISERSSERPPLLKVLERQVTERMMGIRLIRRVTGATGQQNIVAAILGLIVFLLPARARARYLEEWRGELHDLRADGEPWWRRTAYVLDIVLRGAPRQAVILRRRGPRAVE